MVRLAGPILLLAGLAVAAILSAEAPSSRGLVVTWILASALSPERVLPLAGLGLASAFMPYRTSILSGCYVLVAYIAAIVFVDLARNLAATPRLQPLAAPISLALVGLLLIARGRLRACLSLPVAALVGGLLAIATLASDPTLHDPIVPRLGIIVGLWIMIATALTIRSLMRVWLPAAVAPIATAILGSWFIAIGFLYGGATLVTPRALPMNAGWPSRSPTRPFVSDMGFDDLGKELDRLPTDPDPRQSSSPP